MPTTNEQVIESLNRLLAVCTRSEHGFRLAADALTDGELQTVLKQSARQRGRLASELRMEIRQLGGEPEMLGGADQSDRRNPLCAGPRQKAHGVVTECEAMNRAVVTAFETALQDRNLPIELLIATRRQCDEVHETGERLAACESQATKRMGDCVAPTSTAISAVARRQTSGVLYEAG
jgi:uncharacterized protein (TIGR02284 family)